jgi:hypothetical protein
LILKKVTETTSVAKNNLFFTNIGFSAFIQHLIWKWRWVLYEEYFL